jgi:RNA polymerase sigma-70 factor, ECF subfamily
LGNDHELWERFCRGEAAAFEMLYRMHGPKLVMFLRRILGDQGAAEDVMQEMFSSIWQHPNGFEAEKGTLRAYLFGAARKRAADWWRKHGAAEESFQREPAETKGETASLLADAVSRLSVEGRALIWLREVEGYSYEELAAILEVPVGTVGSRLFAAREELRRIWQAKPEKNKED